MAEMAHNLLADAAEVLRRHYGRRVALPPGKWITLVRLVVGRRGSKRGEPDWSWLEETPLRRPEETSLQTGSRLEEIAVEAGFKSSPVKVLPALAGWWLQNFGDADAGAEFGKRSLESWQRDLRAVRGVSWELADRILLVVGGLAVYPLDRGSQRIAARHGWIDLSAEYDEWQALFVGGLRDSGVAIADLSDWNARVGREFCGARPKCEACPLKELLPPQGPIPLATEQ
jgi:endonuclease-3 related protein